MNSRSSCRVGCLGVVPGVSLFSGRGGRGGGPPAAVETPIPGPPVATGPETDEKNFEHSPGCHEWRWIDDPSADSCSSRRIIAASCNHDAEEKDQGTTKNKLDLQRTTKVSSNSFSRG
ncbi:hypothetical protein SESBI_28762 [Sesbania bispinosa]|nr:hypothetical protein SESBI_28762 [Sesbania bispinosa]